MSYSKLSDEEYFKIPHYSQSTLKHLIKNTYAAFLIDSTQKVEGDAVRFGSIAHQVIISKEAFAGPVMKRLDGRTKEGKAQKAQISSLKSFLFEDEHQALQVMQKNFELSTEAKSVRDSALLVEACGLVEVDNYRFPEKAIKLKFKPDMIGPDFIADYKTTSSRLTTSAICKTMSLYHYPFQAAVYLELDAILTGVRKEKFYFIFQETIAPYGVKVVSLGRDTIEIGKNYFDEVINKIIHATNYPEQITPNHKGVETIELLYY